MPPGESAYAKFWFSGVTLPFELSCFIWCPAGQAPDQADASSRLVGDISSGMLAGLIQVQDIGLSGFGGGPEGGRVVISSGVVYNLTFDGKHGHGPEKNGHGHEDSHRHEKDGHGHGNDHEKDSHSHEKDGHSHDMSFTWDASQQCCKFHA